MLDVLPKANPLRVNNRIASAHSVFNSGGVNTPASSSSGGFFSGFTDFFSGLANTGLDVWGKVTQTQTQRDVAKANLRTAQAAASPSLPAPSQADMTPLLIAAGVGLVAILVLKK